MSMSLDLQLIYIHKWRRALNILQDVVNVDRRRSDRPQKAGILGVI